MKSDRESSGSGSKLSTKAYASELQRLQGELIALQQWVRESGTRLVVIFEGRDAAGKGSAIKRIAERLNPRGCRIVALSAPTPVVCGGERGQEALTAQRDRPPAVHHRLRTPATAGGGNSSQAADRRLYPATARSIHRRTRPCRIDRPRSPAADGRAHLSRGNVPSSPGYLHSACRLWSARRASGWRPLRSPC